MIDQQENARRQSRNRQHTLILVLATAALLGGVGWTIAGSLGVFWVLALGGFLLYMGQRVSPKVIVKVYKAQPMNEDNAPVLHSMMVELTKRAGLSKVPDLYYVPSKVPNAFTTGRGENAIVVVFDGLLRQLDQRQIAGVLAHEMAHIKNRDILTLGLADVVSRITSMMRLGAMILALTKIFGSTQEIGWGSVLVLFFAPQLSAALQRALSHAREFDADMDGAVLTGDPRGLASALRSIEESGKSMIEKIFFPGRKASHPSTMRTHPPTAERIDRLLSLEAKSVPTLSPKITFDGPALSNSMAYAEPPAPKRHLSGVWW